MLIIPAIDILKGKCVRLTQGDYSRITEYNDDPIFVAKRFKEMGAKNLHIVDLEGAKYGEILNKEKILEIVDKLDLDVQVGGGIRTFDDARVLLGKGVKKIILGSSIFSDIDLVKRLIMVFGKERVVASVDVKNGMVMTNGWRKNSMNSVESVLEEVKALGIDTIIFTDIKSDGNMSGPNFEAIGKVLESGLNVIVAGGVSSIEDVRKLKELGVYGCIIGKAIYEGKINLKECLTENNPIINSGLSKRIIPCMDVKEGRVVKGISYQNLKDAGNPVELAKFYSKNGADELVFLDITATIENRKTLYELVEKISENINIPFTVGGGIRSIDDIRKLLNSGADKIAICSYAVVNPEFIREASKTFGAQCIVVSIDAKRGNNSWEIYTNGGRVNTKIDAIKFAKKMEFLGAGELLVNSLDRDGTNAGYDIELLRSISESVNIPVIASSGAGDKQDFLKAFNEGRVDAALAASIFHYNKTTIPEIKKYLSKNNINVRL